MLRWLVPSVLGVALTLGVTQPASAQEKQETADVAAARELFREGAKFAESGSWEQARERFERSAKLKRAPLTLYNLGIAQQETGHLADAIESFEAFLAEPADPSTQKYAEQVRGVLPQLEKRVGRVIVTVTPAGLHGLAVRVDGRQIPLDERGFRVDQGPHQVSVAAPGYVDIQQTVVLPEGGRASSNIALVPHPAPKPLGVGLPGGLAIGGLVAFVGGEVMFGIGAAHGLDRVSTDTARRGRTLMLTGNIVAGAGAIAAGVGLVLYLTRLAPKEPAATALATPPATALRPWSDGRVTGVEVRF
jgi:hypothetical protein